MAIDLSQERIEFLESQVILTFQNDGLFYRSSQRFVDADNYDGFRNYIREAQRRVLGAETAQKVTTSNRAYFCARLWAERGGSLKAVEKACEECDLNRSFYYTAKSVFEQMSKPVYDSKLCDPKFYDPKLSTAATGSIAIKSGSNFDEAIAYAINNLTTKEEPTMNPTTANTTSATIPFETKHYVYGRLLETMQQNELINAIKQIEAEIADLKAVKTKSTTIAAKVKELEEMLGKVVDALDGKK